MASWRAWTLWTGIAGAAVGASCSGGGAPADGGTDAVDGAGTDTVDTDTDTDTDTTAGSTGATGETGETGGGGTTEPFDCSTVPTAGPVPYTTYDITTTEDFDFDALGALVYSDWINFVAVDSYGVFSVISPGIEDTRGIQILSDGNIAAAYISQGRLGYTDRLSGSGVTLLSGLSGPNALDVADGDVLYVTETGWGARVIRFDPATSAVTQIADGFTYPNGIALNDAQDTIYVTDSTNGVYRLRADGAGGWMPKELLFNPPLNESYDGIEVDICGNVYVAQFYNGELYRFDPDTLAATLLVDLNDNREFLWNAIRWGSDRGIWRRDALYVTDRNKIFGVEVGVPGRHQPVDLMP